MYQSVTTSACNLAFVWHMTLKLYDIITCAYGARSVIELELMTVLS